MKKFIINENDIRTMVKESVSRILKEHDYDDRYDDYWDDYDYISWNHPVVYINLDTKDCESEPDNCKTDGLWIAFSLTATDSNVERRGPDYHTHAEVTDCEIEDTVEWFLIKNGEFAETDDKGDDIPEPKITTEDADTVCEYAISNNLFEID